MLNREKAALVVVDIQDKIFPEPKSVTANLLANASKVIRCAQELGVPVLVTEQYPERLGATNAQVAEVLGEVPRIPKMEFGCTRNKAFLEALKETGRRQLIVIGMEAHVCVLQTALGALEAGYEVFVVRDAVTSMKKSEYKAAMARLAISGVTLVTAQMAVFELLEAAGTDAFKRLLPLLK